MTHRSSLTAKAATTRFAAIIIIGLALISSPSRPASDQSSSDDDSRIQIGFSAAPVPLNLVGKNRSLAGLGSYIVNVQAECNGCHPAGPATEYLGNPYLFAPPSTTVHQTKKVNPATYLGGGRDFGAYPAPNSPLHIYSRNLTPDEYRNGGVNLLPGFSRMLAYTCRNCEQAVQAG